MPTMRIFVFHCGKVLLFVPATVAPAGLGLNDVALACAQTPPLTVVVPLQFQLMTDRVTQIAPVVGGWYIKYVWKL